MNDPTTDKIRDQAMSRISSMAFFMGGLLGKPVPLDTPVVVQPLFVHEFKFPELGVFNIKGIHD